MECTSSKLEKQHVPVHSNIFNLSFALVGRGALTFRILCKKCPPVRSGQFTRSRLVTLLPKMFEVVPSPQFKTVSENFLKFLKILNSDNLKMSEKGYFDMH